MQLTQQKQQNFNEELQDIKFLFPEGNNIDSLTAHKSFVPFDTVVCDFLNEVSTLIMKDTEARQFSDLVTFGFFCRRANVGQIKKSYEGRLDGRLGRGLTFHIAPSNVPVNFAYTLAAGLLSGNRCVVRASSKDFPQTRILCRVFREAAEEKEFADIKNVFAVVMYGHSAGITAALSSLADIRIVWGGDSTIAEIRKAPLGPRAFDITFADRYSFSVFSASYVSGLDAASLEKIARDFYNDTYLYDQNACSSPRLIVWKGTDKDCAAAKRKFWTAVHEYIIGIYELAPIIAVDKLSAAYRCALELDGAKIVQGCDNLVTRVSLAFLPQDVAEYTCAGGFYLEYDTEDLSDVVPAVTRKFQTLSYLGMDAGNLCTFVIENGLCGIDRIVPVGRTADFSLVWDGYDLISVMSREISCT